MECEQIVLVVDDDTAIVNLIRDFLEAEGFGLEIAQEARTTLRVLKQVPVDCLLLDVMMPGEDGFELCRQIRRSSDVPILFLSARRGCR